MQGSRQRFLILFCCFALSLPARTESFPLFSDFSNERGIFQFPWPLTSSPPPSIVQTEMEVSRSSEETASGKKTQSDPIMQLSGFAEDVKSTEGKSTTTKTTPAGSRESSVTPSPPDYTASFPLYYLPSPSPAMKTTKTKKPSTSPSITTSTFDQIAVQTTESAEEWKKKKPEQPSPASSPSEKESKGYLVTTGLAKQISHSSGQPPASVPEPSIPEILPSEFPEIPPSEFPEMLPSEFPEMPPSEIPETPPSEFPEMPPSEISETPPSEIPQMPPSEIPQTPPSEIPQMPPSEIPETPPSEFHKCLQVRFHKRLQVRFHKRLQVRFQKRLQVRFHKRLQVRFHKCLQVRFHKCLQVRFRQMCPGSKCANAPQMPPSEIPQMPPGEIPMPPGEILHKVPPGEFQKRLQTQKAHEPNAQVRLQKCLQVRLQKCLQVRFQKLRSLWQASVEASEMSMVPITECGPIDVPAEKAEASSPTPFSSSSPLSLKPRKETEEIASLESPFQSSPEVEPPESPSESSPLVSSFEAPESPPESSPLASSFEAPETPPESSPLASSFEAPETISESSPSVSSLEAPESTPESRSSISSSEAPESTPVLSQLEIPTESPESTLVPSQLEIPTESPESTLESSPLVSSSEAPESTPVLSPIEIPSETPESIIALVPLEPVESPDSSISPKSKESTISAPDKPPVLEPKVAIAPETETEASEGKVLTLTEIAKEHKGVQTGAQTPEGKVGLLVPKSVTLTLKNARIEVSDDIDVVIAVMEGKLELKNITISFKQKTIATTHRTLKTKVKTSQKGLLLTDGATASIQDSVFELSTDSMVNLKNKSSLQCTGCIFQHNTGQEGGAIRAEESSVKLVSCTMIDNSASIGGAIYVMGGYYGDKSASLMITDSVLSDNEATTEGGSLFVQNINHCEMIKSTFSHGLAAKQGGVMTAVSTQMLTISESLFEHNRVQESYGGALSISFCSEIKLSKTNFTSNFAFDGGALAIYEKYKADGKVEISDSFFTENESENQGGAILIQTKSHGRNQNSTVVYVTINKSVFQSNSAADGGAIFVSSKAGMDFNLNMGVTQTEFVRNYARKAGGGMYCSEHTFVHFEHSLFDKNKAVTGGSCALFCGCSITKQQTETLESSDVADRGSQIQCMTGETGRGSGSSSSNSKSNTLTYVLITLAVLVGLVVVSIAIVLKNKRAMQSQSRGMLHQSLSSFTGPSRLHHILSVPFSEASELQEEANAATNALLMRTHTYGEIDHDYEPPPVRAAAADASETGSVHSHPFLDDDDDQEEERIAEAILADDAFAVDLQTPVFPRVSSLRRAANNPNE
eukprot:g5790.t2